MQLLASYRATKFLTLVALLTCASRGAAAPPTSTELTKIGLAALRAALGDNAPTGAGISVTQVESPQSGVESQYFVNTALADFTGKTITAKQTPATTSTHATNVAQNFYGNSGIAPGVTTIDVYEANRWLDSSFLRKLSPLAPRVEYRKIQNHSWIANFTVDGQTDVAAAVDVLRRIDYVVNRDGVVVVAGVNNGTASTIPQILGNAYNVIAVGRSDGGGSLGPSTADVIGRSKPDIVAPGVNTSVSTSWVSGAAALLLEAAGTNSAASRPATIKALLMAGASKKAFDLDAATPTTLDDWSRTPTQPLDDRYGAGQLDVYRSYQILAAGQQGPGTLAEVAINGWDAGTIPSGQELTYYFTVPANHVLADLSVLATWNRQIDFTPGVGSQAATLTPSLANVDIHLYRSSGFIKGSLVDESVSNIDNVEHVFQRVLGPGQYMISVTTDATADFSLAWGGQLYLAGDSNFDGRVDGVDYLAWANNFKANGKAYWQGDFDLNGVVDGADYILWANNFSSSSSAAMPQTMLSAAAVPEPSTLGLIAVGCLSTIAYVGFQRRRRSPTSR
jgi:hypothetical protein